MAKQTFTTGQVLTAAQMTSLQQTAMLGGAASAKTASYTLVAADAGTAISMSNASATTITVNTALFAAGDTVQITNLGVGVCTITAGTATVNTSASLALAQYESGTLDFTSTSAAIFIKGAGAAAASGANWSLLNSGGTALTAASTITVSGISGKDKLMILIQGASNTTTDSSDFSIRFNTDSGSNYTKFGGTRTWTTSGEWQVPDQGTTTQIRLSNNGNVAQTTTGYVLLTGGNSSGVKQFQYFGLPNWDGYNAGRSNQGVGFYDSASTISSVSIVSSAGNFDAGTIYVYTSA